MQAHGVDVAGKSVDQLLEEHDAVHDVVGPVAAGEPIPQVQVSYQLDCPDGQCPVSRPVVNAVVNTVGGAAQATRAVARTTGAVIDAALPPYPRSNQSFSGGYGSSGYSAIHGSSGYSTPNYGSGGGYSSTVLNANGYGSGGYSAFSTGGRKPVRSLLKRVFGQ